MLQPIAGTYNDVYAVVMLTMLITVYVHETTRYVATAMVHTMLRTNCALSGYSWPTQRPSVWYFHHKDYNQKRLEMTLLYRETNINVQ